MWRSSQYTITPTLHTLSVTRLSPPPSSSSFTLVLIRLASALQVVRVLLVSSGHIIALGPSQDREHPCRPYRGGRRSLSAGLCALCCVLCAVCCVLCAACCVLCAVYCVLCAVCYVLCTVCCVLCAVCYVLCAVCCVPSQRVYIGDAQCRHWVGIGRRYKTPYVSHLTPPTHTILSFPPLRRSSLLQPLLDCATRTVGSCAGGDDLLAYEWIATHGIEDTSCSPYRASDNQCLPEGRTTCRMCYASGVCEPVSNPTRYDTVGVHGL